MGNKGRLTERARYARTHGIVLGGEISVHMLLVPQESGQGAIATLCWRVTVPTWIG